MTTKQPGGNPERARRAAERRRSNASGTHLDRRLKRLRDRAAVRRAWKKDHDE